MIGKLWIFGAALLAAGSALAGDEAAEDVSGVDGFVETGESVNCVSMRSARIDPIDENRLLFRVGTRYYLNETSGSCNGADSPFSRIEVTLFGPRACRGELLRVVDNNSGAFEGSCSLGEFRALKRKPKEEPASETR